MSETVLNAAGTSAAGTVAGAPMRTVKMQYFGYLYMFFGLCLLVFGNLFVEYPKAGIGNFTPAASFNTTNAGILSVVGILVLVLGYMDYRGAKMSSFKIYFPAVIFILGLVLIPLYSYYGAFTGLLGNSYNLAGASMGGLLLVFASLGEIVLARKKPM
ncbi:MAG: hypothetical protein KGI26_01560 [Thaumarchaeota archaeon]|nr:hypothetical protein [Nitrososphaerota archaeon]